MEECRPQSPEAARGVQPPVAQQPHERDENTCPTRARAAAQVSRLRQADGLDRDATARAIADDREPSRRAREEQGAPRGKSAGCERADARAQRKRSRKRPPPRRRERAAGWNGPRAGCQRRADRFRPAGRSRNGRAPAEERRKSKRQETGRLQESSTGLPREPPGFYGAGSTPDGTDAPRDDPPLPIEHHQRAPVLSILW